MHLLAGRKLEWPQMCIRDSFMVAPGLFLLTRNMLMQKYDANGNGRIDPEEHAAVMKDAAALYWARMKAVSYTHLLTGGIIEGG